MNTNAELLADALESGDYKQNQGGLCRYDNRNDERPSCFCFAGVACDIYQQQTGKGEWHYSYEYDYMGSIIKNRLCFALDDFVTSVEMPRAVHEFFGFSTASANYSHGPAGHSSLICDNDDGQTFKEIAATMRQEPTDLFTESD